MATVLGRGLATPMEVAGPAAARFAAMLGPLGASVDVVGGPVGTAISRKLLRSVFYKGLAAAVVEALAGAEVAGCADWLRQNIAGEMAGFDERTLDRLVTGSRKHAHRRVGEMAAAAEQLRELGVQPRIAGAAENLLRELDLGRPQST
jgi:3-hydroxyisobutyrate dehydrogenase-like beta-hydroxyacid dehydrogenase